MRQCEYALMELTIDHINCGETMPDDELLSFTDVFTRISEGITDASTEDLVRFHNSIHPENQIEYTEDGMFRFVSDAKDFELPRVIQELIAYSPGSWNPVYYGLALQSQVHLSVEGIYNLSGFGITEVDLKSPVSDLLRVECWIHSGNQYVYTERMSTNDPWCPAKLGEHPGDQQTVRTLIDAANAISDDAPKSEVHPALHEFLEYYSD